MNFKVPVRKVPQRRSVFKQKKSACSYRCGRISANADPLTPRSKEADPGTRSRRVDSDGGRDA
jgi:hypothetical protein